MVYRTAPFSMALNGPYPGFKVTPFLDAKYLRNGTRYIVSMEYTNGDLYTPYSTVFFRMTLTDLE